jgi:hypothetical protein
MRTMSLVDQPRGWHPSIAGMPARHQLISVAEFMAEVKIAGLPC